MYQNIRWIKNITNKTGDAYLWEEETFVLDFPIASGKGNVMAPIPGDLIILWQESKGRTFLSHLATPEGDEFIQGDRPEYPLGRKVRTIACTKNLEIDRENTGWKEVYFGGISNGNFCRLNNIKSLDPILLLPILQQETWEQFQPFLLHQEQQNSSEEDFLTVAGFPPEDYSAQEGRLRLIQHLAYERDKMLVQLRKNNARTQGNLYCEACGFNFQTVYCQDFIECHHKFPIAASGPRTNTLEDLALVCSNCHRMLHRKIDGVYLSVEALKELIVLTRKS